MSKEECFCTPLFCVLPKLASATVVVTSTVVAAEERTIVAATAE